MKITFLGQAGIFVETKHGSILCDPWFNPAYFASWFPFPSNEQVDLENLAHPTYLYLSHQHHDHFDPAFLRDHVSKDTTVILPDYPMDALEQAIRALGFTRFIRTKNCQTEDLNGLRVTVMSMVAPVDGPLGDSSMIISDGETCVLNQNDSRPIDLDLLASFGPFDGHFLQFSGAIWYPMVYQYPDKMMRALGAKKRENEQDRAIRYAKQMAATFVFPTSGPPCFLDDALWDMNDFDRDPTNTFPDQTVFLERMAANGMQNGRLMIPGTVATLTPGSCEIAHPVDDETLGKIFTEKRAYLEAYKARQQHVIDAEKASWPRGQVDILAALREWFEPLLAIADLSCVGVNGRVILDCSTPDGTPGVVVDFQQRRVYAYEGQEWEYYFKMDPALLESLIIRHEVDWINTLFLSCRFEAQRKGAYNEYVYNFFKCLSPERIEYAEGYYTEKSDPGQMFETNGYRVQRRCPHLKADLTKFSTVEDGILTCTLHGWRFELDTGKCLTSDDRHLYSQPIASDETTAGTLEHNAEPETAPATTPAGAFVRDKCHDCWYNPKDLPAPANATTKRDEA